MAKKLTLKEKMKTMAGYCSSCGTVIMDLTKKRPSERLLPNHRQHTIELSNGFLTVGVCDACKVELVSGESLTVANTILDNHKIYWKERNVSDDRLKHITVVNPNSSYFEYRLQKQRSIADHKIYTAELDKEMKEIQKRDREEKEKTKNK